MCGALCETLAILRDLKHHLLGYFVHDREHCDEADDVDQNRRQVDSFYLDCHHDDCDGADKPQTDADRMHDAIGYDLSAVVIPADLPGTSVGHSNELADRVHELQQLDNLVSLSTPSYTDLKVRKLARGFPLPFQVFQLLSRRRYRIATPTLIGCETI